MRSAQDGTRNDTLNACAFSLGQSLRSVVPSIGKSQPRVDGKKAWFHTGIRLAKDAPVTLRLIQGGVTGSAGTEAKTPGTVS